MADIEEVLLTDIAHKSDFVRQPYGDISMIKGKANLTDAILRRIITEPGSIVHRPDYGVGLKQYQNAPMTLDKQKELSNLITAELLKDPRIQNIISMRFYVKDDRPDMLTIFIVVETIGLGETEIAVQPFIGE